MIWYNDFEARESRLIHEGHIAECLGIGNSELCSIAEQRGITIVEAANELAYGFSFTEEPEFPGQE